MAVSSPESEWVTTEETWNRPVGRVSEISIFGYTVSLSLLVKVSTQVSGMSGQRIVVITAGKAAIASDNEA
ncbi:hypothetical protein KKC52_14010 [bacterium]|nr:hypothetical protein [bacterium]